jgi:hypothetical protein
MIIHLSSLTGPVKYELTDEPARLSDSGGETYINLTIEAVAGRPATLMLTLEEIDRIYAARRRLHK